MPATRAFAMLTGAEDAVSWFNASRTGVSRHAGLMSQEVGDRSLMLAHLVDSASVIPAVVVERRPVARIVRDCGVSRSWVYELLARYEVEGEGCVRVAFTPPQVLTARDDAGHGRARVEAAQTTRRARVRRGREHQRVALAPPPQHCAVTRGGAPDPGPARRGHPGAGETPEKLLHPV